MICSTDETLIPFLEFFFDLPMWIEINRGYSIGCCHKQPLQHKGSTLCDIFLTPFLLTTLDWSWASFCSLSEAACCGLKNTVWQRTCFLTSEMKAGAKPVLQIIQPTAPPRSHSLALWPTFPEAKWPVKIYEVWQNYLGKKMQGST